MYQSSSVQACNFVKKNKNIQKSVTFFIDIILLSRCIGIA